VVASADKNNNVGAIVPRGLSVLKTKTYPFIHTYFYNINSLKSGLKIRFREGRRDTKGMADQLCVDCNVNSIMEYWMQNGFIQTGK
jgi:hypothetical protein